MKRLQGIKETCKQLGADIGDSLKATKSIILEKAAVAKGKFEEAKGKFEEEWTGYVAESLGEMLTDDREFVVEVVEARDVPAKDMFSPSDPYIQGHISLLSGTEYVRISEFFRTSVKIGNTHPIWHHFARLGCTPPQDSFLTLNLFNFDRMTSYSVASRLLGTVRIPARDLCRNEDPLSFPFEAQKSIDIRKNPCFQVTVRRACLYQPAPERITILLIRHGESAWNKAVSERNVGGLMALDHPLSLEGLEQAKRLGQELKAAWESVEDDLLLGGSTETFNTAASAAAPVIFSERAQRMEYLRKFLHADAVYSSPLTRAVQTALVALRDHPTVQMRGLRLYSGVREVKTAGGMDTVGTKCGHDIVAHVRTQLAGLVGEDEAADLTRPAVDFYDCNQAWWTPAMQADSESDVADRVRDLLSLARHAGGRTAGVFVGHSIIFRALCRALLSEPSHPPGGGMLERNRPGLARRLREEKLANGAVLALTVVFAPGGGGKVGAAAAGLGAYVEDADLIMGSFKAKK